jgi:signal transduction histidine kinase
LNGRAAGYRLAALALFLIAIELAVRLTPLGMEHWHYALHRLYYPAIIGAGLAFGWMGGLATAIVSGAAYLLHTSTAESPDARNELDRYLETMVFCLAGLLSGVLADRERAQRRQAERAARELKLVYRELQENLEHLKRAAWMSALGHMAAGLAHEIRNPLASIEGAAEIVASAPEDPPRRKEFLHIIQQECRRLNRLVTNFLEFARPRVPEPQSVDLPLLVESVVKVVKQTAARHNVTFTLEQGRNLPAVECDAEQIKQVLLNLILNAVQAMPHGGEITIAITLEQRAVAVRVRDSGTGISAAAVDSIFDPFFTTKETGTGLGLPTAYQIIEQHGGELSLEKNDASGATFLFNLPLKRRQRA